MKNTSTSGKGTNGWDKQRTDDTKERFSELENI